MFLNSARLVTLELLMVLTTALLAESSLHGDEGMWLMNRPPRKLLKERYGFEPSDEWLAHLRRASVRFNSGGSGSFVSSSGLVMTNHHVGADCLQKLSSSEHDYIRDGFFAREGAEELKCVDLEINVLVDIDDVTARVEEAVAGLDQAKAGAARRAVMNTIEQESLAETGLRSDVVTLYQGGEYHLYRYKKYTDVRLVFAPEKDVAFFGGDPDNFEFPRYDLDICFFRVYEDGEAAKTEHFLRFSESGAGDGELVFVSGHPGRTNRLNTVAHLKFLRDRTYPMQLNLLRRREVLLKTYSDRGLENARRAQDDLFSEQNRRKARLGGLAGLQDPAIMGRKLLREKALRQAVAKDKKLAARCGEAWKQVETSLGVLAGIQIEYNLLEAMLGFNCELFHVARGVVRLVDETTKPNAERLREYGEAGLDSLKQRLFSEAPIHKDLETIKLADSLGMFAEMVGADDALVRRVLDGRSPSERASDLIAGTRLEDVAFREELVAGGRDAIESCDDPLIKLARLIDEPARKLRKTFEEQVDEPQRRAYGQIAKAQFVLYGSDVYPDATFTLRLAFGVVKGFREAGKEIPPWTTIDGAFEHSEAHGGVPPFQLPGRWWDHRPDLDPETPFNFVCTADIIGGNSGSPVVNRAGELVGIIFDGNIQSLVLDFAYSDEQARAVSVHSSAIREALRNVYDAGQFADELGR
ncbi:MAG TPA: S46 family peptidase [Pirellulales bacterium]|nr:S46 family peptidase [Pirellulales bacterium]